MASASGTVLPLAERVAFDGCVGWFHAPVRALGLGRGVVLCAPFGHEALGTGRGWRIFAETLAAAGLPTLRFDYPGTGDAADDDDHAPHRLDGWIGSVGAAGALLRERAGVTEVALCGLRLGADLAAAAAARCPRGFGALALLAPVGSGRLWRRQFLLGAAGPDAGAADCEWVENGGFRVRRCDLDAAAEALDLSKALAGAAVPRVLVLAPAPVLGPDACARLRAAGSAVEHRGFAGLGEFVRGAHLSVVPHSAFADAADWLRQGAPPAPTDTHRRPPALNVLRVGQGAYERLLRFGPSDGLVGVLCEPAPNRAVRSAPAVLLPNTGANGRIGNGRVAVRLARHLAECGIASFRMDAAGIGDGGPDSGGAAPPDTYDPRLIEDLRAALDLLQDRAPSGILVAGVCSGAHAAFQAAVLDRRIRGLVLANLPAFDRSAGGAPALDGGPPPGERPALRRPRMLFRRFKAEADRFVAARFGWDIGLDRPGRWMRGLQARGVPVVLSYSARDRGLRELRAHFGRGGRRLPTSGSVRCVVLGGTDHSLLPRAMQDEFIALVEAQALRMASPPAAVAAQTPRPAERSAFGVGARIAALLHPRRQSPLRTRHAGLLQGRFDP